MAALTTNPWSPSTASGAELLNYHNCLTSIGIPALPWTAERHANLLVLISWRELNPWVRRLYDEKWQNGSIRNLTGARSLMRRDPDAGWCWELRQLRFKAYGWSTDKIEPPEQIVRYPWALTDGEFLVCYRTVKYGGKAPELAETNEALKSIFDNAADKAWDQAKEVISEFALTIGGLALKGRRLTLAGLAGDIAKAALLSYLGKQQLERLRIAYECDKVRRGPSCVA